jgi:2-dehydropantoate 2-reductase
LPEKTVADVLGKERAYGAAVTFGANWVGDGVVELTSNLSAMSILCGGYQNDNGKNTVLKGVLEKAGAVSGNPDFVKMTDNLAGARWSKLAINAAFSTLSTITGLTFGEVAKRRKTRKLALSILREAIAVAKASDIRLEKMQGHDFEKVFGGKGFFKTQIIYALLPMAIKKHRLLKSGMLGDIEKGRRCDVDFVCGALVAVGKEVGVETPVAESAVALVHGIENGLYEITPENVDFLI